MSNEKEDIEKMVNELVGDTLSDTQQSQAIAPQTAGTQQSTANPTQANQPMQQDNSPVKIEPSEATLPSKKDFLKEDPIIKAILNDSGVFDLLDVVLSELAEESSSLKYERIKKELANQDTDRLSLRRSNILKMISDALIQKRNLALNDFINLRSPQWQLVFDQLMQRITQTLKELSYSTEQVELFFQKLQGNLEGFEEVTEQKLKESVYKVN